MKEKLEDELHNVMVARVPCVAISTPERVNLIDEVAELAYNPRLAQGGRPVRVFVWRLHGGFSEYGVCLPVLGEDGRTSHFERLEVPVGNPATLSRAGEMEITDNFAPNPTPPSGENMYVPENPDNPTMMVQYAIDFINNFREESGIGPRTDIDGDEKVIFILRDWDNAINMSSQFVDKQLALLEDIIDTSSRLATDARIQPTVIMHTAKSWKTLRDNGTPMIPAELRESIRMLDYDRPNKSERMALIQGIIASEIESENDFPELYKIDEAQVETIADGCAGMTRQRIEEVIYISIGANQTVEIEMVLDEKSKLIEDEGFDIIRPNEGFESIGGLSPLKAWIRKNGTLFSEAARDAGLEPPRGLIMAGVPGCGKSATVYAMASEWNMNIMKVDGTHLKGSLVGQSEKKAAKLLSIAKSAAPIILFVDEAEKLLGNQEGSLDGGAHSAVLGQLLSFMQDDDSGVFFAFTANDMDKLAPELVDRFPGRFGIGLPKPNERSEIIRYHIGKKKNDPEDFDIDLLVTRTKGFSGRNIEDIIREGLTDAFYEDNRTPTTDDLLNVISNYVPTSVSKADQIQKYDKYLADGHLRAANDVGNEQKKGNGKRAVRSSSRLSNDSSVPTDDF
jgi:ATP-dependent 26S proteasome regulatory subunit